jgi:hypothetical protein
MLLPTVLFQRFALVSPSSIEYFGLLLTDAVLHTLSISKDVYSVHPSTVDL